MLVHVNVLYELPSQWDCYTSWKEGCSPIAWDDGFRARDGRCRMPGRKKDDAKITVLISQRSTANKRLISIPGLGNLKTKARDKPHKKLHKYCTAHMDKPQLYCPFSSAQYDEISTMTRSEHCRKQLFPVHLLPHYDETTCWFRHAIIEHFRLCREIISPLRQEPSTLSSGEKKRLKRAFVLFIRRRLNRIRCEGKI